MVMYVAMILTITEQTDKLDCYKTGYKQCSIARILDRDILFLFLFSSNDIIIYIFRRLQIYIDEIHYTLCLRKKHQL